MNDFKSVKYLKLPFQFDKERLQSDLNLILSSNWVPHYNIQAYEGDWQSISLYSTKGNEEDIFAIQNPSLELQKTSALEKSEYLVEVIESFKCQLLSVRLLKLSIGAIIKPHRDYKLGYEDDNFRLHIPIRTNSEVKFILGGDRLLMLEGECWYTNVNYTHSVSNMGKQDRIHLVLDCQRNSWSDDLFFSLVDKKYLLPDNSNDMLDQYRNMIKTFERLEEPASEELIKKYKIKIAELKKAMELDK